MARACHADHDPLTTQRVAYDRQPMNAFMYSVYVSACTHACTHACTCTCTYACTYACTHACACACTWSVRALVLVLVKLCTIRIVYGATPSRYYPACCCFYHSYVKYFHLLSLTFTYFHFYYLWYYPLFFTFLDASLPSIQFLFPWADFMHSGSHLSDQCNFLCTFSHIGLN